MITFNISGLDAVRDRMAGIDTDKLCYDVASTLKAKVKHRVHAEGEASDGSKIGTYSKAYMKVRTGNYSDAKKLTRGPRKGEFEDKKTKGQAGVFTRGPRKGQSRPVYNRGTGKEVVLSLTRYMENDMNDTEPIKIDGGYGIGYSNGHNYDKAIWNVERYGKPIWNLTDGEKKLAEEVVNTYIDAINH